MKLFLTVIISALTLSGCLEPTVEKSNDKWSGTYADNNLRATLRNASGGYFLKLDVKSQNGQCKGSFASELAVVSPDEQSIVFGSGAPGKAWCEVTITRDNNDTLRISETKECGSLHGDTCPFDGKVIRAH